MVRFGWPACLILLVTIWWTLLLYFTEVEAEAQRGLSHSRLEAAREVEAESLALSLCSYPTLPGAAAKSSQLGYVMDLFISLFQNLDHEWRTHSGRNGCGKKSDIPGEGHLQRTLQRAPVSTVD